MTTDDLRVRFKAESERIEEAIRKAMRPQNMDLMTPHDLTIHHRAAVLALTAILGDLFIMIPDPDIREKVRSGALEVLAPIPSQELH